MITLVREGFHDLSIGSISKWPYGAEGEYHVMPDSAYTGNWEEANITYAWRSGSGCWKVISEDGRRVMEQTIFIETDTPLLVTGSRFWDDYVASVDIRPLSWKRPFGLVVRYVHSRRYYLFALFQDHVAFILRDHEREVILGTAPWQGGVDRYYRVSVACEGERLAASIGGQPILTVADGFVHEGRIGLLAETPARFAEVEVTTDEVSGARISAAEAAWRVEEERLQSENPAPLIWKRFETKGYGTDRNLRFGDLDGDGEMEIVIPQGIHHGADDAFAMVNCLTAVDLDGNVLWQVGEPTDTCPHMTGDLCVQVYDWDGDGCAEVVYTQDFRLKVLDGRTGQVKQQIPTPFDRDRSPEKPYERVTGDSIYFCDLEGRGERRNLILKDRYQTIWAFDNALNLLWTRHLNTGHYPIAYDIDGDGCEELLVGYTMLDNDGSVLWELDISDHLDGAFVGRLGGEDAPIRVAMGCSDEGFVLADANGNILVHELHGHCQGTNVAHILPDRDDLQIAAITFWHHPGIVTLYDTEGKVLTQFEPLQIGSILPPVDWAGKGTSLLLHNTHPGFGGMFDGVGHRAVIFPDDGHPLMCSEAIDLSGDGHQEIVTWDWDAIWIYRADPAGLPSARVYNMTPIYNNSNYRSRWLI